MKYFRLLLLMVIFVLAGSNLTWADKIKIGFSLPTQQNERWSFDLKAMEKEAQKADIELLCTVAQNDQMQQNEQIDELLSQGINVLIMAPHDAAGAAVAVKKAADKDVKVIAYDRLILNAKIDAYISFDNEKVGELQGEYLTKRVPKGNYIILSGSPTDNNARYLKDGAMKFIQPLIDAGKIKVLVDHPVVDWMPYKAQELVELALAEAKGDIDAILAPNDDTAGGAVKALEAYKLAGKVAVTGQDSEVFAVRRIVAGTQAMTVFKDTRQLAKTALLVAVKLANGQDISPEITTKINNFKIDVPTILLPPVAVEKRSINKILIDSGYLSREQVYGKNRPL